MRFFYILTVLALQSINDTLPDSNLEGTDMSEEIPLVDSYEGLTSNGVLKGQFNHEVQQLMINQVDSKIDDLEDIKIQYAIYDRHIKKHTEDENYKTWHNNELKQLQDSVQEQEKTLQEFKNHLLKNNSEVNATFIREANKLLDQSERFAEKGFDMIEIAVDEHVASDEHKQEHGHKHDNDGEDHGHNHHQSDSFADYVDLVPVETEFEVEVDKQEMLLDFIDQEVYDLAKIIDEKSKLEKHISAHQSHGTDIDETGNELHLDVASNVLKELNADSLTSHEMSLLEAKKRLKNSPRQMSLEDVDEVAGIMLNAEDLIKSSQEKLQLVELLDEEFEENDAGQSSEAFKTDIVSDRELKMSPKPTGLDVEVNLDSMLDPIEKTLVNLKDKNSYDSSDKHDAMFKEDMDLSRIKDNDYDDSPRNSAHENKEENVIRVDNRPQV